MVPISLWFFSGGEKSLTASVCVNAAEPKVIRFWFYVSSLQSIVKNICQKMTKVFLVFQTFFFFFWFSIFEACLPKKGFFRNILEHLLSLFLITKFSFAIFFITWCTINNDKRYFRTVFEWVDAKCFIPSHICSDSPFLKG